MKKLLALLLALTLIFTFAACGDSKGGGKGGDSSSNTYETPIENIIEAKGSKEFMDNFDLYLARYNGFCEEEIKALKKLLPQVDGYEETLEYRKASFAEQVAEMEEEYGSNYKYSYKILEKTALTEEKLDGLRDDVKNTADRYMEILDSTEDFDNDDWEDFADDLGFNGDKKLAKEFIDILDAACKKYKNAEIEEGYSVEVEITLSGSKLEEDEVTVDSYDVIKIDGRWASYTAVNGFID